MHIRMDMNCRLRELGVRRGRSALGVVVVVLVLVYWQAPAGQTEDAREWVAYEANNPVVLAALRTHHLQVPSSLPYNLSPNLWSLEGPYNYSWNWINTRVREVFEGERSGFFVEAGALNGEFMSDSLWLEKELGWKGLLIEPDAASYKALLAKHRKAWTSNACVSPSSNPEKLTFVSHHGARRVKMWNWIYRSAGHVLRPGEEFLDHDSITMKSYSVVQCFPLLSYLLALNVSAVDFLSLDVGGGEGPMLQALLEAKSVEVRVIVVQDRDRTLDTAAVETHGYLLLDSDVDHIFIKRNDVVLQRDRVKGRLGAGRSVA